MTPYKTYKCITFDINDIENSKIFLEENGYVVYKNILSQEEINEGERLFREDWTYVSPRFNFDDKSTWISNNLPMMLAKGMATYSGFGQSNFMWYMRQQPNIKRIYENLLEEKEIVVSMDGFSTVFYSIKTPKWLHRDQHPDNKDIWYQGSYNFKKVTEHSSGLTLVPKSHKFIIKKDKSYKADWVLVDSIFYEKDAIKLLIPENCFVVWNSNTIHSNEGMSGKTTEFNRLTCFITYMKKSLRSEKIKLEKISAYKNGETTSHWAIKCDIKKYPWGFGPQYEKKKFNKIKPLLTEENEIPEDRLALL